MKPIDHPEFFERAPPPGRSRESTIVLNGLGRFQHEGDLVEHQGLQLGFVKWIRRHPKNDRLILCNGYDWCYFGVESTPYFVRRLKTGAADGPIDLLLFDDSEERLIPETLSLDPDGVLRCRVKDGQFAARFLQQAQRDVMPWLTSVQPTTLTILKRAWVVPATSQNND